MFNEFNQGFPYHPKPSGLRHIELYWPGTDTVQPWKMVRIPGLFKESRIGLKWYGIVPMCFGRFGAGSGPIWAGPYSKGGKEVFSKFHRIL